MISTGSAPFLSAVCLHRWRRLDSRDQRPGLRPSRHSASRKPWRGPVPQRTDHHRDPRAVAALFAASNSLALGWPTPHHITVALIGY
jgi:hypothetical protein